MDEIIGDINGIILNSNNTILLKSVKKIKL